MSIETNLAADAATLKTAAAADLSKAEQYVKSEETKIVAATYSFKVLAIAAGVAFVIGLFVGHAL